LELVINLAINLRMFCIAASYRVPCLARSNCIRGRSVSSTETAACEGAIMASGDIQIDNAMFRVTKWTIEPLDAIPMHVHEHDYVVVPLVNDTMHVTNADGSAFAVDLRSGKSYTRPAGAEHIVTNPGTDPIAFVEIEKL
jgi:mannose-6-phosphate isomerase-like protein (cupin superfamily)